MKGNLDFASPTWQRGISFVVFSKIIQQRHFTERQRTSIHTFPSLFAPLPRGKGAQYLITALCPASIGDCEFGSAPA
jgi:hypothetical protein